MHGYNVRVPGDSDAASRLDNPFSGIAPFNLAHAMTELMTPGISLPEVAATVPPQSMCSSDARKVTTRSVAARC